jgi:hypothetical protein
MTMSHANNLSFPFSHQRGEVFPAVPAQASLFVDVYFFLLLDFN